MSKKIKLTANVDQTICGVKNLRVFLFTASKLMCLDYWKGAAKFLIF